MSTLLNLLGSGRVVLFSALLYVIGQTGMLWLLPDLGPDLLKLQLTTSWETFQLIQVTWTHAQWDQYRMHFTPDFVFPWVYGLFLFCWMLRHTLDSPLWIRLGWCLPLLASVADCVENWIHLRLLDQQQDAVFWVMTSGWISRFKWGCAFTLVLLFTGLEIRHILRSRKG